MFVADLVAYANQYATNEKSIEQLFRQFTVAQLNWPPNPSQWSVAQCVEHLNTFGRSALDAIDKMIQEGTSKEMFRKERPVHYGILGNLLIKSIEPPYRLKFKAVKNIVPLYQEYDTNIVLSNFHLLHEALIDRLKAANALDFVRIKHPIPPTNIKLPLGQWFALIAAHERRHIWQAKRVVEQHHEFFNP